MSLRRAAIIFGAPLVVVVGALLLLALIDGPSRLAAKFLNPRVALGAAVVSAAVALWWAAALFAYWRSRRRAGRAPTAPIVAIIVLAIVSAIPIVPFSAAWFYGLSVADRNFGTGCDPTLDCPLGPTPSGIAVGPTTPPPSGPTFPPEDTPEPSEPPATIAPGPSPSFDWTKLPLDDGWLNVLLVGIDSRCAGMGVVTGANTDTMIVASANADTGQVFMFSFPRDVAGFPLYVGGTMPGYWKLNTFTGYTKQHPEVFPEPGLPALSYELGYLLGIPIDYYASINICGFPQLIEEVGGVDICNTKLIQDSMYHWTDGHLGFTLEAGPHHLDGETALAYARSRHGSSDFARARRQQELLGALRKAVLTPQNLARLPEIVSTAGELVHTNFPTENIEELLALADKLQDDKPGQYVFQPPLWASHPPRIETNGRSVQFLKLDAIAALSREVFGDKSLYEAGGVVPSFAPTTLPSSTPGPSPALENPC